MHGAVHGQGQGQEVEGVEASADVSTGLTLHLGLELSVEEIHHDGAVPAQVVVPRLEGGGQREASSDTSRPVNPSNQDTETRTQRASGDTAV